MAGAFFLPFTHDYMCLYYEFLHISTSHIAIRTSKPGEVLSSTFEFQSDATFMDDTTKHRKATNNHFDVKWEIYKQNNESHLS